MLDTTLDAALEVVMASNVGVGGCDVAVEWRGSGCRRRGYGACRGAVARPGSKCHRVRGVWGWFRGGEAVAVVVVDAIGHC